MFNFKRLIKSFQYAFRGLGKTFKEEQNLQIQLIGGLAAVFLGIFFSISRLEWVLLSFLIALVMLMELANSAVERITDILKPRLDNYVKEIKDISSAAVLLSAILSLVAGFIIFYPYIISRFFQ